MSSISTGIGLVSGIDIADLVTKLMEIERRPVDMLEARVQTLTAKKTVFIELAARLLKIKISADSMSGDHSVFTSRVATSSNESVVTATAARGTPLGDYSFTVKSLVSAHQTVSGGYANRTSTVGAGTITIEMGAGNLDAATALDSLNGGEGVEAGLILVTDRAGRSQQIDLAGAVTVEDVLDAINSATSIGVRASVSGDSIILTDTTGQAVSNLKVDEVLGGATAAGLGILGSVAAGTLTGSDVVSMSGRTALDDLNDGRGVRTAAGLDDIRIYRRDDTSFTVNLSDAETVQDALDAVNNAAGNVGGLVTASISAGGSGITITDATGGSADLMVESINGSRAAEDLGIAASASENTIAGARIVAGLNTVLLSSLNGGSGVGRGSIEITDRAGTSVIVDLSTAATAAEVISRINAGGAAVTAALNPSGTGITLTDTSMGEGTFAVQDVDSTTAADLGIAASVDAAVIRGANVQRQYISENTELADLNGGKGVYKGRFRVTDRTGNTATIDLSQEDDTTIDEVLSEINAWGIGVTASINATGDGILLTDTTGGPGVLKVADLGGGTTAADLRIAGEADAGDPAHIDGSFEYRIDVLATDTLDDIAAKLEDSGADVSAGVLDDGSRTDPWRLTLSSGVAGSVGRMAVDTGDLDLGFFTTQKARDAVLLYGQAMPGVGRMVVTSTTNTITGLVDGLTLNLKSASDSAVSVSVTSDDDAIVDAVGAFVEDWNSVIDRIKELTSFNEETSEASLLLGDSTMLRVEDMLNRMMSYNAPGANPRYNRLSRVGVSFMETGRVSFDAVKMRQALASARDDVETLFATEETGLGAHFSSVLDSMTDDYNGLIKRNNDRYDDQIQVFSEQIENMNLRLAKVQARLYAEFYAMEEALAQLETQRSAIENMPNYFLYGNTGKKQDS